MESGFLSIHSAGWRVPLGVLSTNVCFVGGLQGGFLAACRPMICVDACFIKGKWSGQLHAAIARDANDDIYPIAYAICEAETRDTWTWFLKILLDDIGYDREHMWSFISDRQKVIFNVH
jgi:hypothetical protein